MARSRSRPPRGGGSLTGSKSAAGRDFRRAVRQAVNINVMLLTAPGDRGFGEMPEHAKHGRQHERENADGSRLTNTGGGLRTACPTGVDGRARCPHRAGAAMDIYETASMIAATGRLFARVTFATAVQQRPHQRHQRTASGFRLKLVVCAVWRCTGNARRRCRLATPARLGY